METGSAPAESPARWGELFQGRRALTSGVLCLGIWLNAVDALVAATIMPSVAQDIGGYAYFAWATAGFMLGSILAGAGAGLLAERVGRRRALASCGLLYAAGCVASAMAGTIWLFLVGRLIQGAGAGFVVGLCYVSVRADFPERMWSGVFASLSGVWGVATLLGPLVGGLFAGWRLWRGVFWLFAFQAVAFALAVRTLPPERSPATSGQRGVPGLQLAVLTLAVLLVAGAGLLHQAWSAGLAVGAGAVLLALALRLDGRAACRLLPRDAGRLGSPAAQGYAAVATLSAAAIGFSVYGAALLQARLGLSPLQAGYVVASESIGWTVTAVLAAGAPAAMRPLFIRLGSTAVAVGVAGCALTLSSAGVAMISACGAVMGGGFGLCWSFISQRVLKALPEGEGGIGSAAIPSMQILGNAVGAAAAGALANLLGLAGGFTARTAASASPLLLGAFVPVALLGAAAAWTLADGPDRSPEDA
jgi:MFS family permease